MIDLSSLISPYHFRWKKRNFTSQIQKQMGNLLSLNQSQMKETQG